MATPLERLRIAYAVTAGDRLLPGSGEYGVGAIAIVFPEQSSADQYAAQNQDALASLGRWPVRVVPVGDPWTFMRRAAGEGLAGIESPDHVAMPERFMFMVRVEEAGSEFPTVLAVHDGDGSWSTCLTRSGPKQFDHAEVLHWQRYDIIDPVSGQWGQACPFRSWDHGDVLYELAGEDALLLLGDVPLLGDWNSTEGAFPFFTTEEGVSTFVRRWLRTGDNRIVVGRPAGPATEEEAIAQLQPRPVSDLLARLAQLRDINVFAAWCINPVGHREDSGCGRFVDVMEGTDGIFQYQMAAVSGIWEVLPGNAFRLQTPLAPWSGHDTIRWSGGQSLQLTKLDRSFVFERSPRPAGLDGLTETEAEEYVASELDSASLQDSVQRLLNMSDERGLDKFHIHCWDAVTGEVAPCSFSTFWDALCYLVAFEREHDRRHRISGAESHGHIGFRGSADARSETLKSERFQLGVRRIGLRVAQRGYRPQDAADLVALCNGMLRTLHVDFAGFAQDLIWASGDADELVCEPLDIDVEEAREWISSAEVPFDPEGEQLVVARIGKVSWARLNPKSKHFLATAIVHLAALGSAPQIDYAPHSLEIVKALEVELGDRFIRFRDALGGRTLAHDENSPEDLALAKFLARKAPLTLGNMGYVLWRANDGGSELRAEFAAYIRDLPNGEFLTSKAFARDGLARVLNKFRNRGAHDSPINEETCRDCVKTLLGDVANPGFIPLVAI